MTAGFRDHMVMWSKDVGRSVDYLESRSDIAKDKIGYIGLSTGATLAPVFLAIEPRISLGVIYMGGINLQPSLTRSGYGQLRAARDSAGADAQRKVRQLLPDGQLAGAAVQAPRHSSRTQAPRRIRAGHNIPRTEMIKEVVDWMEKYWGTPTPRFRSPEEAGLTRVDTPLSAASTGPTIAQRRANKQNHEQTYQPMGEHHVATPARSLLKSCRRTIPSWYRRCGRTAAGP